MHDTFVIAVPEGSSTRGAMKAPRCTVPQSAAHYAALHGLRANAPSAPTTCGAHATLLWKGKEKKAFNGSSWFCPTTAL